MRKLEKYKKYSINRKTYYIMLIGVVVTSLLLLVIALNIGTTTRKMVVENIYYYHDKLNYYVYLRPNFLYNKSILKNSNIYTNITKKVIVKYYFSASNLNGNPIHGDYKILAKIQTKEWNKTIILSGPRSYTNSYSTSFPIDFSYFKEIYNRINRDLKFKGANPRVYITIETKIKSENFSDKYSHTLWYPIGSKVFRINTIKNYEKTKKIYKLKTVNDQNKCTLKLILSAFSGILAILFVVLFIILKPVDIVKDTATLIYEKNKDYMVLGKIEIQSKNIVQVDNIKELFKLAEILNKPIIKDDKTFGIVDNNVLYKFKLEE